MAHIEVLWNINNVIDDLLLKSKSSSHFAVCDSPSLYFHFSLMPWNGTLHFLCSVQRNSFNDGVSIFFSVALKVYWFQSCNVLWPLSTKHRKKKSKILLLESRTVHSFSASAYENFATGNSSFGVFLFVSLCWKFYRKIRQKDPNQDWIIGCYQ